MSNQQDGITTTKTVGVVFGAFVICFFMSFVSGWFTALIVFMIITGIILYGHYMGKDEPLKEQ